MLAAVSRLGTYPYAGIAYANPDAVMTRVANGVWTTTYSYDNNGNLISAGTGAATTTYTILRSKWNRYVKETSQPKHFGK
jgi:hypothetical protein